MMGTSPRKVTNFSAIVPRVTNRSGQLRDNHNPESLMNCANQSVGNALPKNGFMERVPMRDKGVQ